MAITLSHDSLTIEIFDDPAFEESSADKNQYDKVIELESEKHIRISVRHGIKVYQNEKLVSSAIIIGHGGVTSARNGAALIDQDNLIICCSNNVFSLSLPQLKVNWSTQADWVTCFSIHQYKDSFISEGEMSVARIDRTGMVLWSYSGADIFVCPDEGVPFEMHEDFIALTDFEESTYKIDYDGNTIEYIKSEASKNLKVVEVSLKSKKPWWRFW